MTQLDRHEIYQSANRPTLMLGADRELVIGAILACVVIAFSFGNVWGLVGAGLFWVALIAILQAMGKSDPLMRRVYMRHMRYRLYYPAKAGLYSRSLPVPRNWGV